MKFFLLIYLTGIFSTTVFAQGKTVPEFEFVVKGEVPKMQLNDNNEIEFIYSKNRIAKVAFSENKNKNLNYKLTFGNTSCPLKFKIPVCSMNSWFNFYYFKLIWAQNPDKKLINKVVEPVESEFSAPFTFMDWSMKFWANAAQKPFLFSERIKEATPTTIQCDQFNWIPQNSSIFEKISFETFNLSKESETSEVKSVAVFDKVKFSQKNNILTFDSIKPYSLSSLADLTALSAPVSSETFVVSIKNKSGLCNYEINRDISKSLLIKMLNDSMTDYTVLKFSDLNSGINQLSQILDDELTAFEPRYALVRKQLPLVIQALVVFSLARIEYNTLPNGRIKITVTSWDLAK